MSPTLKWHLRNDPKDALLIGTVLAVGLPVGIAYEAVALVARVVAAPVNILTSRLES